MKDTVKALLEQALDSLKAQDLLPKDVQPKIGVEQTRDPAHGDWASNLAMMLAKPAGKPPRDVAQALIDALPAHPAITGVEIAGPGFINFRLAQGVAYYRSRMHSTPAIATVRVSPATIRFRSNSSAPTQRGLCTWGMVAALHTALRFRAYWLLPATVFSVSTT